LDPIHQTRSDLDSPLRLVLTFIVATAPTNFDTATIASVATSVAPSDLSVAIATVQAVAS
jgi:hypothetical protein